MTVVLFFVPAYFRTFIHFLLLPIVPERGSCWFVCFSWTANFPTKIPAYFDAAYFSSVSFFIHFFFFCWPSKVWHDFVFVFMRALFGLEPIRGLSIKYWFPDLNILRVNHFNMRSVLSNRFWCGFPSKLWTQCPFRLTIGRGWVWRKKNGGDCHRIAIKKGLHDRTHHIFYDHPRNTWEGGRCQRFRLWLFPAWFWVIPGWTVLPGSLLRSYGKGGTQSGLFICRGYDFFTMFDGSLWQ